MSKQLPRLMPISKRIRRFTIFLPCYSNIHVGRGTDSKLITFGVSSYLQVVILLNIRELTKLFLKTEACPTLTYINHRTLLIRSIQNNINLNNLNHEQVLHVLLFGDRQLPYKTNCSIFQAVQQYIKSTKRF